MTPFQPDKCKTDDKTCILIACHVHLMTLDLSFHYIFDLRPSIQCAAAKNGKYLRHVTTTLWWEFDNSCFTIFLFYTTVSNFCEIFLVRPALLVALLFLLLFSLCFSHFANFSPLQSYCYCLLSFFSTFASRKSSFSSGWSVS